MPGLDSQTIEDLTERAKRFLDQSGGYEDISFIDAGGSAAVFRVIRKGRTSALKVFDPKFFSGSRGASERRRLEVQRKLIGHSCDSLVQTFCAEEAENTAFVEMEFIEWPQLAKCLANIPDKSVVLLIGQLVEAVRYLEEKNIVHRDIKPENIHVSNDFKHLKLLDLGVSREFDSLDENDAAITDDAQRRPFLATAQYSSPEYLFRLDQPTSKLWKGLNFYQVGAVLHDLINKEPLFGYEISLENRWLVARAVLTKLPSFTTAESDTLSKAKALALRCLCKDIDTRLALVSWEDFNLEGSTDPLSALKGRLSRTTVIQGAQRARSLTEKLNFERIQFLNSLFGNVRAELIGVCGTQLPLEMVISDENTFSEAHFTFSPEFDLNLRCFIRVEWQSGIHEKTALVSLSAQIAAKSKTIDSNSMTFTPVFEISINEDSSNSAVLIASEISLRVVNALDLMETAGEQIMQLDGFEISNKENSDEN